LWIKAFTGKDSSLRTLKTATTDSFSVMTYFLHRKFTSLVSR
jgi:hypothetical protein